MKSVILTAVCLVTFATFATLVACEKPASEMKPEEKGATSTTNATTEAGVAMTATPTPAATPVTINEGDLSTPADFEETAEKAITAKNYKTELSTLEAEIAKE